MKNKVLGIIGGGQLGRMIALSASHLGVKSYIFDPSNNSPAFDIASKVFNYKYDDIETFVSAAMSRLNPDGILIVESSPREFPISPFRVK